MKNKTFSSILSVILILVINALVVGGIVYLFNLGNFNAFKNGLLYSSSIYFILFLFSISSGVEGIAARPMYESSVGSGGLKGSTENYFKAKTVLMSFPVKMLAVTIINMAIGLLI